MKFSATYGELFWFSLKHLFINAFAALTLIGIYFSIPYSVGELGKFIVNHTIKE